MDDEKKETTAQNTVDPERLSKQLRFILEVDKEKNILRQTHLSGHGRREDDAEHAWHMALMCWLLQEYSNAPIDTGRTMLMCLVHDLVEIDAGDTYAYDEEGKKTQHQREEKAADRIFGLLPKDQANALRGLFEEFERDDTQEAHFAHAMDNFQPLLLNDANGGADWKAHGVSREQVNGRQYKTEAGSEVLFAKTKEILDANEAAGCFRKDNREKS